MQGFAIVRHSGGAYDIQFPPTVFNHPVAYGQVMDKLGQ